MAPPRAGRCPPVGWPPSSGTALRGSIHRWTTRTERTVPQDGGRDDASEFLGNQVRGHLAPGEGPVRKVTGGCYSANRLVHTTAPIARPSTHHTRGSRYWRARSGRPGSARPPRAVHRRRDREARSAPRSELFPELDGGIEPGDPAIAVGADAHVSVRTERFPAQGHGARPAATTRSDRNANSRACNGVRNTRTASGPSSVSSRTTDSSNSVSLTASNSTTTDSASASQPSPIVPTRNSTSSGVTNGLRSSSSPVSAAPPCRTGDEPPRGADPSCPRAPAPAASRAARSPPGRRARPGDRRTGRPARRPSPLRIDQGAENVYRARHCTSSNSSYRLIIRLVAVTDLTSGNGLARVGLVPRPSRPLKSPRCRSYAGRTVWCPCTGSR